METDLSADERVNGWLLAAYRTDSDDAHLADCPDATILHTEGADGLYGCDTGCEYVRLTCTVSCPHGHQQDYTYGAFGELAAILEDVAAWAPPAG